MRLPIKESGKNKDSVGIINELHANLLHSFEVLIRKNVSTFKTKVMLGDFSVIDIVSFDPNQVVKAFTDLESTLNKSSSSWQTVSVQSTKSDDLRRIYLQLSLEIDKFYFYVYMGIQFHSLFYYQADKEVIRISKEIRELEAANHSTKSDIGIEGDKIIREELEKLGYKDTNNSELFEELFTKNDLTQRLVEKASKIEESFPSIEINTSLISSLKSQLESFIVEAFQLNLASLDQNKMLQGEEGMVMYVDFEMFKNKKSYEKTSVISFEKIPESVFSQMKVEFDILRNLLEP